MSAVVSILLWLGVITPGVHTTSEISQLTARHSGVVNWVMSNPYLLHLAQQCESDELVIIVRPSEGD